MIKKVTLIASLISGVCFSLIASAAPLLFYTSTIDIGMQNEAGIQSASVTAERNSFKFSGNMVNALCGINNCQLSNPNPNSLITANGNAIALNAQEGKSFIGAITIPLTIQVSVPGKGNETVTTAPTITFTGLGGFMMNFADGQIITSKTDPKLRCQLNLQAETTQKGMLIPLLLVQCMERP